MTLEQIKLVAENPESSFEQVMAAIKALNALWAKIDAITEISPTKH